MLTAINPGAFVLAVVWYALLVASPAAAGTLGFICSPRHSVTHILAWQSNPAKHMHDERVDKTLALNLGWLGYTARGRWATGEAGFVYFLSWTGPGCCRQPYYSHRLNRRCPGQQAAHARNSAFQRNMPICKDVKHCCICTVPPDLPTCVSRIFCGPVPEFFYTLQPGVLLTHMI